MPESFLNRYGSGQAAKSPIGINWHALGPAVALTTLAVVFVCLRWYTRLCLLHRIGLEDWLVTAAVLISIAMTAVIGCEVKISISVPEIEPEFMSLVSTVSKLIIAGNTLYQAAITATKASILTQYIQIFDDPRVRLVCILLLILCIGAAGYGIFGGIFLCKPVSRYWEPWKPGYCSNAHTYWMVIAAIGVALDFAIWLLPMPLIRRLRMPRRQMIGLVIVFALGGFTCVVSLVRLIVVHMRSVQGRYDDAGIAAVTWSTCEANVGIICACLMALKPLVLRVFPNIANDEHPPHHSTQLPLVAEGQDQSAMTETAPSEGTWGARTRSLSIGGLTSVAGRDGVGESGVL